MPANSSKDTDKAINRLREEIQRDRLRLSQLLQLTPEDPETPDSAVRLSHVFSLMKET